MTVYLATIMTPSEVESLRAFKPPKPSLLVSYVYRDKFLGPMWGRPDYRQWALDSGAFTAWSEGAVIDLDAYAAFIHEMLARDDGRLVDVFSLDVIGDWRAGAKNTERLWAKGIRAIPTYHAGEPEDVLVGLARDFDKIAIGGLVGKPANYKRKVCEQVFARVWPKKIHGFGVASRPLVLGLPWHSVDASNWASQPLKYGRWHLSHPATRASRAQYVGSRGSAQSLESEIAYYMALERLATHRWEKETACVS